MSTLQETSENLLSFCGDKRYSTIYADPPWRFQNRTGKVAPENKKLNRYETMSLADIMALPVEQVAAAKSHLYLWVPNALGDGVVGIFLPYLGKWAANGLSSRSGIDHCFVLECYR